MATGDVKRVKNCRFIGDTQWAMSWTTSAVTV